MSEQEFISTSLGTEDMETENPYLKEEMEEKKAIEEEKQKQVEINMEKLKEKGQDALDWLKKNTQSL